MNLKTAFTFAVCFSFACSDGTAAEHQAMMPASARDLFKKYCYECHDSSSMEGNVDLETLPLVISRDIPTADLWSKVLNAINSGEMPPEDVDPISDLEKSTFLESLSNEMVVARRVLSDSGGEITLRRLNRREYANTIESLLGVRPDVTNLPDDQATSGFDTQGASLFFSSDQLEQYLAAANSALELALNPRKKVETKVIRVQPEEQYTPHYAAAAAKLQDKLDRAAAWKSQTEKPASEFGFLDEYEAKKSSINSAKWLRQLKWYLDQPETKMGAALILTIKDGGYTKVKLPNLNEDADGKYIVRLRAAVYPDADERFQYVEFSSGFGSARKYLGWRKVTGTLDEPQIIEFPIDHQVGEKKQIWIHQRSHQDRGDKNLWTIDLDKNGMGTPPGVWIDWAELEGPLADDVETDFASKIMPPKPSDWSEEQYAKAVITRFARMAFRGDEPDTTYLNQLLSLYTANRASEMSVKDSLIDPLSIILASPRFVYLMEANGQSQLSDRELATRLSFFLWSAPPDAELHQLARDGRLSDPAVLQQQTTRLLADPRADRFVKGFVHQWLQMERLGMFQYDGVQFPTFDNAVRENARDEIYQTVHHMIDAKLPLGTLLKSEYVVINDVLAGYYGIDGVDGHQFRAVPVPKDSIRGGLLGTAAVLAMGSDGQRSSAVERGAWVLRHLLNDPPPPAPPNVPQLSRLAGQVLSARELGTAHQEQPQCANCHKKIDSIGFGLENFDASGSWREMELVSTGARKAKSKAFPIDPRGVMPNGTSFENYHELRDAVAKETDAFARGFAESLISYGLGRPYGFTDQDLADEMIEKSRPSQYEISELIHSLVQSRAFQSK
ncbi:hypothetical protein Poly51_13910 [Rubripirellula tenax]|uniref:Planctomycete cytochrome C n=1 Tax=Rubripirellula tenax TaxID=2528015 RepID=A0A5C6FD04_9BACT|nr:DUF1592 domain-containing protein [Rubripirellula tenax]TWU58612.1 hypothetical protein Poly51_13910 [Rubripirellula tenax]